MAQSVFILRTDADEAMAAKVCAHLKAHGIACICEHAPETDRGEEPAPIILLILSQAANDDDEILRQTREAIATNKVLIPFRVENFRATGEMQDHLRWRYVHEAYGPSLETHLAELVRMIKPLLHGRSVRLSEATSISRTLPSRAAILRNPEQTEAGTPSGIPIQAQLFFPHPLVSGIATAIECILTNTGELPLFGVQLLLECRGFKHDVPYLHGEVPAGDSRRVVLDVVPSGFGPFDLRLTVQYQQQEMVTSCSGTPSVRILEAPEPGEFPAVLPQLSQTLGFSQGTQRVPVALPSSIASSDDLARFRLPERFELIELARDYDVSLASFTRASTASPLRIPDDFLQQAQTGTLLQLTPLESTDVDPYQSIRLVSRPQFVLGRSGEDSDFVLWFWPRNELHDTKTRRISKKHVTLALEGNRILIRNTAAGSLTTYDGQDVSATGTPLQRRSVLNLSGIYLLDVQHVPAFRDSLAIANLGDWQGAVSVDSTIPPLGSVRLSPRTAGVLPQNSTWLLNDATFGSSQANPVILQGLADIQGRFHHAHGAFWIEAFGAGVQVDAYPAAEGTIIPLLTGQVLRIGAIAYSVSVSV